MTPFGKDMDTMDLGRQLSGGECMRHFVALRFDVEYTSVPLGSRNAQAFILDACQRELGTPAVTQGCTAHMLAERLQRANDKHIWPQRLLTLPGQKAAIVDWEEVAEQFVLFLQAAMSKSLRLQQVVSQMRLGQMCVLALWWAYFKYSKNSISRPSTVTTLFLEKKQYIPVDAVIAPEKPYFTTVPLLGRPVLTAPRVCQLCGARFRDWASLVGHCKRDHGGCNGYQKRHL